MLFAKLKRLEVTALPNLILLPFARPEFSSIVIFLKICEATVTIFESESRLSFSFEIYSSNEPTEDYM